MLALVLLRSLYLCPVVAAASIQPFFVPLTFSSLGPLLLLVWAAAAVAVHAVVSGGTGRFDCIYDSCTCSFPRLVSSRALSALVHGVCGLTCVCAPRCVLLCEQHAACLDGTVWVSWVATHSTTSDCVFVCVEGQCGAQVLWVGIPKLSVCCCCERQCWQTLLRMTGLLWPG